MKDIKIKVTTYGRPIGEIGVVASSPLYDWHPVAWFVAEDLLVDGQQRNGYLVDGTIGEALNALRKHG